MTLIVETGAGLANADSYVSTQDAQTYAKNYGLAFGGQASALEPALRRATAFIDATYRVRFPGYRKRYRGQTLEWPRSGAFVTTPYGEVNGSQAYAPRDASYLYAQSLQPLPDDAVPIEVMRATIVAASAALLSPGPLSTATPTTEAGQGQEIKREEAGDHKFEYFPSRSAAAIARTGAFLGPAVEAILATLLIPGSGLTARAMRG